MPIQGMTNRKPRLAEAGKLRKGGPKPSATRPGPDLPYFRFTSPNPTLEQRFLDAYGDQPAEITVYLPYETTDQNWSAWIEKWDGGGRLIFRGDGKTLVKHMVDKATGEYSFEPVPHPTIEKNGKMIPDGSQKGRLTVQIPALQTIEPVTLTTGSVFDILWIDSTLRQYEVTFGDLRGIPFLLKRVQRPITRPGPNGKRLPDTRWLIELAPAPYWVSQYFDGIERPGAASAPVTPANVDPETGEILTGLDVDPFEQAWDFEEDEGEAEEPLWPSTKFTSAEELKAQLVGLAFSSGKTAKPNAKVLTAFRKALQEAAGGDTALAGQILSAVFGVKSTELTLGQVEAFSIWMDNSAGLADEVALFAN